MSNQKIPNRATGSDMAKQMLKNPALVALAAAFGLVLIAAVVATIMGLAEDARKANQGIR